MHYIFYALHILGMAVIILTSSFLIIKKDLQLEQQKKIALYMMSAAHTQLLTGFILFFLLLSEVHHMKIGIKVLFAIDIAVLATMFKKKISQGIIPNKIFLMSIFLSAIFVTIIAFFL